MTQPRQTELKHLTQSITELSAGGDDPKVKEEERDWELGHREEVSRLEIARLKELLRSLQDDIAARKKYAKWIFWMVVGWLIVILGIVILVGLEKLKLDSTVVLGLIGSTTVNVTAFFLVVTKYLFPSGQENQKSA